MKKYQHHFQKWCCCSFVWLVGVGVGVATWVNKLSLKLNLLAVAVTEISTFIRTDGQG